MPGSERGIPPRLWVFLGGCLLSAAGSGVVAPFTAIYLTAARQFPLGTVSLVLAVIAAANVAGSLAGGLLIDRFGVRGVVAVSLAGQAVGYVGLGLAATPGRALAAAALIGVGGGAFYPTSVPILVMLTPSALRRRAFSLRSLTISLGIGLGAAVGGQLIGVTSVGTFQLMFVVNAVSYLAFAALLLAVLWRAEPTARADRQPRSGPAGPTERVLLLLLVLQTLVVLAGYGQFNSSVPLLLQSGLAVDAGLIGALVATGTLVLVLVQLPVGRLSEAHPPATMLAALGVVWALGWGCGLLAVAVSGTARTVALVAMAVLYGIGTCLFQPNFQPLLTNAVPAERLGRASGYAASAWGVALVVASPLGVLLVGLGPVALWAALIVVCAAVVGLARRIGRLLATDPPENHELAGTPAESSRRLP